ncbi:hypothetical protein [Alteriqipengyuania sp. 357]
MVTLPRLQGRQRDRLGGISDRSGPSGNDPIADIRYDRQVAAMGKRSGVPHRDDELHKLSNDELKSELERSRRRLSVAPSTKMAKQWQKRIHWRQSALVAREIE